MEPMKPSQVVRNLCVLAALGLTGCQTTSNVAPHYRGETYKRLPSANAVREGRLPDKNVDAYFKQRKKDGYVMVGKALFTGEQEGLDQLKSFAASIGADLVEGLIIPVGKQQRTYMGVSSYTPGRTLTSYGTSSGYASGSGSGTLYSPYGAMNYNSQGSATSFGTSTTSTYVPAEITYAPMSYEVLITQQAYVFWLSPSGYLRNWLDMAKEFNAGRPPEQRQSLEETKVQAAIYAQAWNVPLPANLRPKTPIPQLTEKERAKIRSVNLQ